ncbi:MAG: hypothetical protein OMM_12258, partial [Candidatus Magnetoglobus multicellularis str. Araruama]
MKIYTNKHISVDIGDIPNNEPTAITFTLSPEASNITWVTIGIDASSGEISFTPVANGYGYTVFVVTADDGEDIATQNFALTITAVNDPPAFTLSTNSLSLDEDFATTESITVTRGPVPANESTAVTYSLSPSSLTWVNMDIDKATGDISITKVDNGYGTQVVTVTADDGESSNNSYTQTFTLTVNSINDKPVITSADSFSVSENTAIGTIVHTITSTDVEGDTLT